MFSPMHNDLDAALKTLREQHERLTATVGELDEVTATATTRDRTVKATVDSRGTLTELTFHGRRWRELAPKELGAKIVDVVAEAQRSAAASTNELMVGLVPDGVDLTRLREAGPDLDAMLDDAIREAGRWER